MLLLLSRWVVAELSGETPATDDQTAFRQAQGPEPGDGVTIMTTRRVSQATPLRSDLPNFSTS